MIVCRNFNFSKMAATLRPNRLSFALFAGGLVGSAGWVTTTVGGSEQPMRWSMPDTSESVRPAAAPAAPRRARRL